MKTYNPNDVVMDARDAAGALMNGIECFIFIDAEGRNAGRLIGAWTGPDTAEAALVIWGYGDRPDLAARGEHTLEDEDALGCAFFGAFEKVRGGLGEHYGVNLPQDEWYGRSWEYHVQSAGWKVYRA